MALVGSWVMVVGVVRVVVVGQLGAQTPHPDIVFEGLSHHLDPSLTIALNCLGVDLPPDLRPSLTTIN